jgi:hypothetical protein
LGIVDTLAISALCDAISAKKSLGIVDRLAISASRDAISAKKMLGIVDTVAISASCDAISSGCGGEQGCQMEYFHTKNPYLGICISEGLGM